MNSNEIYGRHGPRSENLIKQYTRFVDRFAAAAVFISWNSFAVQRPDTYRVYNTYRVVGTLRQIESARTDWKRGNKCTYVPTYLPTYLPRYISDRRLGPRVSTGAQNR